MLAVSDSNGLLAAPAVVADSFGSPATIGRLFLTDYLLAFEAISLVLLVGAIAGVVLGAGDLLPSRPASGRRRPTAASPRASATTCAARSSAASDDEQEHESEVGA